MYVDERIIYYPFIFITFTLAWSQINLMYLFYLIKNFDIDIDELNKFKQESSPLYRHYYRMASNERFKHDFVKAFDASENSVIAYILFLIMVIFSFSIGVILLIECIDSNSVSLTMGAVVITLVSFLTMLHSVFPLLRLRQGKFKKK